ncbi:hypothetical protein Ddye_012846 [Dipteronia dyeriana]|uniref:SWIM-type domain-containing protein n=1 Tax=Dipteronia dyeriana TaxID=168575 RepID=A0AAE0CJ26_9ROSI|nr:hypothetical protein Ddye_012846 [Dipteronia dyeriana]
MDPDSYFGSMSKTNLVMKKGGPSAWDNVNTVDKNYHCGGSSYSMNDLDEHDSDHSLFTDLILSTTPVSTSNICNLPKLIELDEPRQFRSLQPTDVIGKEFSSVANAESFYNNYSKAVGFSTRKDEMRRDRQGVITRRRWFVTQHTHGLVSQNHTQFLRSHQSVKESDIAQLKSWRTVGVKTAQVMDHFVDQAGSFSNVGHTKEDLQNRLDAVRKNELQSSDADCVISYLTVKTVIDPEFFFEYTTDEDDRFGNLFWADSTSRSDYGCFGDVLAFDATYKTNVYQRPLVMLVGVNHHKSTTIFGFGLLGDETVETYTWLLRTFLVAMHEKMPQSVVTDGDKAMHKAIKTVMANSVRRLCCWHLERNVQTNIQDGNFTRAFCSSMLTYMTLEDFELKWKNMVLKYRLNNNDWVNALYCKRKLWAETYLRQSFFGGMRSTQRYESMNSFLNRFVHCRLKLYEFMQNIDRALDRIRHTETFNDNQCGNTTPVYSTHLTSLDKHVATIYTRNLFFLVRDEIKEETLFSICNFVQDVDRFTYTLKRFGFDNLTWTTCFIPSTNQIQCSCKLFETSGIPCSHAFSVMKAMNVKNILSSLILAR